MGRNCIKVARPGYDVFTTEVKNLTIDSTKNQLKEYLSGSGTVTIVKEAWDRPKKIVEIAHNLGYQPLFTGWFKLGDTDYWETIPSAFYFTVGELDARIFGAMSRPTANILQLHFYDMDIFGPGYTQDIDYKYIIYIDPYKDAWTQS